VVGNPNLQLNFIKLPIPNNKYLIPNNDIQHPILRSIIDEGSNICKKNLPQMQNYPAQRDRKSDLRKQAAQATAGIKEDKHWQGLQA
jgi:hypothetical protein